MRAPDNVLYLTSFWGMKGYEALVFRREGGATLVCLEASAEDAARTAWTDDVCYLRGYADDDPRPPLARTIELASEAAHGHGTIGLELSLGTQASDRMVGEPTTFTHEWFHAFGTGIADATQLLARARALKTEQELERMRLANEIAAAAMEHCRERLEPGMKESEAGALWNGFVHGEGTGWKGRVELAHGVGARAHEPPYAHQAGSGTIRKGMVLAIEPGIYWEGGGGLRVEDNFLVTADGVEKLSSFPDGVVCG